ncbi:MAG: sugar nucleotide-binding protein [Gammaproteobacteria bacterium]|nr:sugar nucleotide-binding protein [Pseudomonadales bacterium]MCP5346892.1 sugar nucleotide-binding protein [Pseudomonadales bacterium]
MKLLIAGAEAPTGLELQDLLRKQGLDFVLLPDKLLLTADKTGLDRLVNTSRPDQLINLHTFEPGSQLALQHAESGRQECASIQRDHAALLANLSEHHEIPMLHLSSCYVFDGEKRLGYNEQDETHPVGVFGTTALQGELAVQKLAQHVILRIGWPFGRRQHDVIENWIRSCKQHKGNLQVLQRRFSPTPNEDVARVVLAICRQLDCDANVWGTYHYCGLETKKEIEFVQQVLKYASQHDEQIYQFLDNFTMTEEPIDAPEISNSTLSSKKIFDTFGIKQRSWHGSLQSTIKTIYQGGDRSGSDSQLNTPTKLSDSVGSRGLH